MNPVASVQITRNRYTILACGTIVLMVLPALAFVSLVAGMVCGPAIRKMADKHAKRD